MLTSAPAEQTTAAEIAAILADQAELSMRQAELNMRAFRVLQRAFGLSPALERLALGAAAILSPEPPPERTAAALKPTPPYEGPGRLAAAFAAKRDAAPPAAPEPAESRTGEGRRILQASTPTPSPEPKLEPAPEAPRAEAKAKPARAGALAAVGATFIEPSPGSQRHVIYQAWADSQDTSADVARRLGLAYNVLCARLSEGRRAGAPLVIAGDKARGLSVKAPAAAPPAKSLHEALRGQPATAAAMRPAAPAPAPVAAVTVRVPPVKPELTPRPPARPILPKNTAPKPPPEPLPPCSNPVQIRARAELRNRVLDHYEANGDHPNVTARKLGTTLREVEWFIHDARQASDKRVRLGDVRRARQERAGR